MSLELFENLPPASPPKRVLCTEENYRESVKERYYYNRLCRHDAYENWEIFEEHRETFVAWMRHYERDAWMRVGDKCHNPDGTLSSLVWVMQTAIEPDRSRLMPCLDFEERFQQCFIRRGLIAYLTLLLKEMEP